MGDGKQKGVMTSSSLLSGRQISSSLLNRDIASITHPRTERKHVAESGVGTTRSPASPGYHHTSLPCLGLMGCMCLLRVTLLADEQRNSLWKVSKCCQDLDSLLSRLPKSPAFPVYILYIRMRTP